MSKKLSIFILLMFVFTSALAGCSSKPVVLEVYAGEAMKSSMLVIQEVYEQQHPNVTINYNFAASRTLEETMRTLQQGDLYLASSTDIERMSQDGLIVESHPLASLVPAIIVRKDNNVIKSWDDLAGDGIRIAIINPDLGVAGAMAAKVVGNSSLKDAIHANITTFTATSSELVQLLLEGKVDAVILWSAIGQTNSNLAAIEIPAEINQSLEMWVAIPTFTTSKVDASNLMEFIRGVDGQQILKSAGFTILVK